MTARPTTHDAASGDVNIAYQLVGDGPVDLVFVAGAVSHVDLIWDDPPRAAFFSRLATFARLIVLDKRGTGASDPAVVGDLVTRIDDVRAVMDAARPRPTRRRSDGPAPSGSPPAPTPVAASRR